MKNLEALRIYEIKPTRTKLIIGGAYYCWTSGDFTYTSDTDDTGNPSESGQPINCSPIAVVSAAVGPQTPKETASGSGAGSASTAGAHN